MFTDHWNRYYLNVCLEQAKMSKDPSTKVGAMIVGPDMETRSTGFNGFPRNIKDDERLHTQDKYDLIIHAEMNAIMNAVRIGVSVKDCIMFMIAMNKDGTIWSGTPCVRCAVHIIQAGIKEVNFLKTDVPDRWKASMTASKLVFKEAGVIVNELDLGDYYA